ncbi:MAG: YlxR family protein [Defluviitaleaceae bacterium]|nr:YlxR family protein [Defluviitaleaceae bacterium]
MKNKNSLFRIVATADGKIFFDADGKAQGRGAYICKNPDCLQKTQKSKGLERSLKRVVPSEIFMVLGR